MAEQENTVKLLKQDAKFIKIGKEACLGNTTIDLQNPKTSATTTYGVELAIGSAASANGQCSCVAIGTKAKSTGGLAIGPYSTAGSGQISFGISNGLYHNMDGHDEEFKTVFTTDFNSFRDIVTGTKVTQSITPASGSIEYRDPKTSFLVKTKNIDASKYFGFTPLTGGDIRAYLCAEPITGHIDVERGGIFIGNTTLTGDVPVSGNGYTSVGVNASVKPLATVLGYNSEADYCGISIGFKSGVEQPRAGECNNGISIGYKSSAGGLYRRDTEGNVIGSIQGIAIGPYANAAGSEITFSNGLVYVKILFTKFVELMCGAIDSHYCTSGYVGLEYKESDTTQNIPRNYPYID